MRAYIIVTIQDKEKHYNYDIEVPTNVPSAQLVGDISATLNSYNRALGLSPAGRYLYCQRLDRCIDGQETFADAGIWNGDILMMV